MESQKGLLVVLGVFLMSTDLCRASAQPAPIVMLLKNASQQQSYHSGFHFLREIKEVDIGTVKSMCSFALS